MFEILANLILTSLFLQSQAQDQVVLNNLVQEEYRLPESGVRELKQIAPQKNTASDSVGVEITAKSVLAVDTQTNKILYQKNSDEVRSIASITKLMTALVFIDHNPGWEKTIKIIDSDKRPGGITHLIIGEEFTVQDIFYATLVASANEAAVALARSTGLSYDEFISEMNKKADELDMINTTFVDMTGLSPNNQSTVADIAILAQNAFSYQNIVRAASTEEHYLLILNKNIRRKIVSTNKVLGQRFGFESDSYVVEAGKTGYLEKAGYCLASQVRNQKGQKILIVVLGSDSINDRFADTKSLAYWIFNNYNWP